MCVNTEERTAVLYFLDKNIEFSLALLYKIVFTSLLVLVSAERLYIDREMQIIVYEIDDIYQILMDCIAYVNRRLSVFIRKIIFEQTNFSGRYTKFINLARFNFLFYLFSFFVQVFYLPGHNRLIFFFRFWEDARSVIYLICIPYLLFSINAMMKNRYNLDLFYLFDDSLFVCVFSFFLSFSN